MTKSITNKYNLTSPIDGAGKPRKYVQYVLLLENGVSKTKKEILEDMGVDTSKIQIRGFANKPLKIMKDREILSYDRSTKKWSLGNKGKEFIKTVNDSIIKFNS
jgi:hypothetical protein